MSCSTNISSEENKMISFKRIVSADIISSVMAVLSWSVLSPYISILQGLLTVPIITTFMLLSALSTEVLKELSKRTSYAQILIIRRVYDIVAVTTLLIVYMIFSQKVFVLTFLVVALPFNVLLSAESAKLNGIIGGIYPSRLIEAINIRARMLNNRARGLI